MPNNYPLKFSVKIWVLMILLVISVTFLISFIGYRVASVALYEKGEKILTNAVHMAIEVFELQQADVEEGELTIDTAQEAVKTMLRRNASVDLGMSGYFVVMDGSGSILVHPTLEGTNGNTLKDLSKEEIYFASEAVEIAKQGGGFVTYEWYLGPDEVDRMVLYAQYYEPWDWVIMATTYKSEFNKHVPVLLNTFFIVVILSVFVIGIFVKLLVNGYNHMIASVIQNRETLIIRNEELEEANSEIQALYEEMLASEEMLQFNYNELDAYKKALEEEKENYRKIMTASNEAYWQYSKVREEITVTNFSKDMLKLTMPFSEFLDKVYADDLEIIKSSFSNSAMMKSSVFEFEARVLIDDSTDLYHWFHWIGIDEDTYLFGSMTDINTEMLNRERIEFYAFHDPVLGLYNMDYLNEIINKALVSGLVEGQHALIVIGVVGFARLLNAYGKNLTDIMSFQFSAEISAIFKDAAYISTLHSGRFAIWIKCESISDCVVSAIEALSVAIKSNVGIFENMSMPIQAAYGATLVDGTRKVSSMVIAEAELAFEYAVENGIFNEVKWYDISLQIAKERTVLIEQQLLKAIDNEELTVVYQPQFVSLESMEIIGYEALLRWHNEILGYVGPSEFIPLAESLDQVNQLGRFVIDEVTSFISMKQKKGETVKISINASYKELLQNDYVSYLINLVELLGINREQLNIEITESTISEYLDVVSESLTALRHQQFEIQMDDFGTGYSSLYQLGRLPIQVLKIDKIFTWALETDEKMFALTKLIIDTAHRMEIKIIAEGVETMTQYEILKKMGCDYYQGFLFSKPLRADEV